MEPQRWRNLGVEGRPPTPAVTVMAGVLFYLLSQQLSALGSLSIAVVIVALDCVRIRRPKSITMRSEPVPGDEALRMKRLN
ncbi:hypothetical protein ACR9VJ_18210 [Streptomyces sp. H49]|uniref:hypothetical protein n=1 Tax=Streptomyces sp. H49 TaxID=3444117 RepID=UPI003F4AC0E6